MKLFGIIMEGGMTAFVEGETAVDAGKAWDDFTAKIEKRQFPPVHMIRAVADKNGNVYLGPEPVQQPLRAVPPGTPADESLN